MIYEIVQSLSRDRGANMIRLEKAAVFLYN